MKPESFDEQLSRFDLMCEGDPTFDLSDNDIAALLAVRTEMRVMARSTLASTQRISELEAKLAALDWTPITEGYTVPGEWESKCVLITHESSVKIGFQTTSYDWCVDGRVLKVRPTAWKPLPEPFVAMEGK